MKKRGYVQAWWQLCIILKLLAGEYYNIWTSLSNQHAYNRITAGREEQETQTVSSKQGNVTFLIEEWQISLETVSFHLSERTKKLGIYCNGRPLASTSS